MNLSNYTGRLQARFVRLGHDPKTDWYFALSVFIVALAITVAIDAYLTVDVTRSAEDIETETTNTVTLDREALAAAAKRIKESALTSPAIPEAALRDPSL